MFTTQNHRIQTLVDLSQIPELFQHWKIKELTVFGSILRDDFNPNQSDIDLLVSFTEDAHWILFDWIDMQDDFEQILHRKVDLVSRRGIEDSQNVNRRQSIFNSAQVIYVAP
ncbi:nucleotidyltransferase domain-containing protein [Thermosynechococcaceae cyanobacterium BACA0444]|uniref:Nucleotidyltransferase domain-containing protein n=1 Tax=Pseudocalidococcus azoricus BACA0444 TaxID=2918990 RepID=A0AAE4FQZ4_9CYAN|nr:nucleotidyltransferase domain-containing protein [Pseudocalidococcus azoricus]MDS3860480.1 nucleotidyltransferase domain-containing protein [Pseudocalidococcus azoricus BACA0444]